MAAANYDACETRVLASEGGYSNNPKDPGGPTNWGITIFDARLYWKRDATAEDVKAMPKSVAQGIYRRKYWDALDCDVLPSGLDYSVFDYGVNSGIARSGKVLRECLRIAGGDWHVTTDVLAAIGQCDVKTIIDRLDDERLQFLQGLKTWPEFGRGWGPRVASVKAISLRMAGSALPSSAAAGPPPPASPDLPSAKGVEEAHDLFAHLQPTVGWSSLWQRISAAI